MEQTRGLTVKLRGRPGAPDWSRGCTLSSRTRGDTTDVHGPLQRLLGAIGSASKKPIIRWCHWLLESSLGCLGEHLRAQELQIHRGGANNDASAGQSGVVANPTRAVMLNPAFQLPMGITSGVHCVVRSTEFNNLYRCLWKKRQRQLPRAASGKC